jgi:hypothetical protein
MSPAAGTARPDDATGLDVLLAVIVSVAAIVLLPLGYGLGRSTLPATPPVSLARPAAAQVADVAAELDRAGKRQGVCYGWQIRLRSADGTLLHVGSSAGDGISVRTAPGCRRWLELVAVLGKNKRHRERLMLDLVDSATPPDSSGLRVSYRLPPGSVGVERKAFYAHAGTGVLQVARGLPLIAADRGLVPPTHAEPAPAAAARPLPPLGDDFVRERLGIIVIALAVLAFTLVLYLMYPGARPWRRRVSSSPPPR